MDKFANEQDPRLRRWLRKTGLSTADAEEVAQESWLSFLSSTRFENRSSRSTYLFGIGKNKARERSRTRTYLELKTDFEGGDTPEGILRNAEAVRRIESCIDELPENQKTVLQERAFEERSVSSIAKKLRTTANNVSVLLHRARAFMFSCVHEQGPAR